MWILDHAPGSEYSRWHRVCLTMLDCDVVMMYIFPCELLAVAGVKAACRSDANERGVIAFGGMTEERGEPK